MTAVQFDSEFRALVRTERKITREILLKINEAADNGHYLALGFSSLFHWLTEGHGYSEPAASRRTAAASILRAVPDAAEKIENGEVNLTTLSQAKTAMRAHTKQTGESVSADEQAEIVNDISNKTANEVTVTMFEKFPETASTVHQERETILSAELTRLAYNFGKEQMEDLRWVQDFWSHLIPDGDLALIFGKLLRDFRKDEVAKGERAMARAAKAAGSAKTESEVPDKPSTSVRAEGTSVTENSRVKVSKNASKRISLHRVMRQCEWVDPVTGRRCDSRYMVESDHIRPRALGGPDDLWNRRCLCRAHNRYEAEQKLGVFYKNGRVYRTTAKRSSR